MCRLQARARRSVFRLRLKKAGTILSMMVQQTVEFGLLALVEVKPSRHIALQKRCAFTSIADFNICAFFQNQTQMLKNCIVQFLSQQETAQLTYTVRGMSGGPLRRRLLRRPPGGCAGGSRGARRRRRRCLDGPSRLLPQDRPDPEEDGNKTSWISLPTVEVQRQT